MPIIRNEEALSPAQRQIVADLVHEIRTEANASDSPTIIEDRSPYTSNIGVTVIWERWRGVSQDRRSRIIMEAYTDAGRNNPTYTNPVGISLAMGLTPLEADKLGVRY